MGLVLKLVCPKVPMAARNRVTPLRPSFTIRIGPGKLEITCIDAQDLLRQLIEPLRPVSVR